MNHSLDNSGDCHSASSSTRTQEGKSKSDWQWLMLHFAAPYVFAYLVWCHKKLRKKYQNMRIVALQLDHTKAKLVLQVDNYYMLFVEITGFTTTKSCSWFAMPLHHTTKKHPTSLGTLSNPTPIHIQSWPSCLFHTRAWLTAVTSAHINPTTHTFPSFHPHLPVMYESLLRL